jgi:hypothetical protein
MLLSVYLQVSWKSAQQRPYFWYGGESNHICASIARVCNTVAVKEDQVRPVSCVTGCAFVVLCSTTSDLIALFSHKYLSKAGHASRSSGQVLVMVD